jgi:hypothetical protein
MFPAALNPAPPTLSNNSVTGLLDQHACVSTYSALSNMAYNLTAAFPLLLGHFANCFDPQLLFVHTACLLLVCVLLLAQMHRHCWWRLGGCTSGSPESTISRRPSSGDPAVQRLSIASRSFCL